MDTTPSSQNPDALKVIIFRAAEAIVSELGASQLTFASLSERSKIDESFSMYVHCNVGIDILRRAGDYMDPG